MNKRLGILGAMGSIVTFVGAVTIIAFMPNGWAASAGGFPAMSGDIPFLMKDVALLAVSIYLLKEDVVRVSHQVKPAAGEKSWSGYVPNDTSSASSPWKARQH